MEPGFSPEWKIFNTSYAMYLAVLGSMVHGSDSGFAPNTSAAIAYQTDRCAATLICCEECPMPHQIVL